MAPRDARALAKVRCVSGGGCDKETPPTLNKTQIMSTTTLARFLTPTLSSTRREFTNR